MAGSERRRELRRRRHRKRKLGQLKRRVDKASPSEKTELANKVRGITPAAEDIIVRWGIDDNN